MIAHDKRNVEMIYEMHVNCFESRLGRRDSLSPRLPILSQDSFGCERDASEGWTLAVEAPRAERVDAEAPKNTRHRIDCPTCRRQPISCIRKAVSSYAAQTYPDGTYSRFVPLMPIINVCTQGRDHRRGVSPFPAMIAILDHIDSPTLERRASLTKAK